MSESVNIWKVLFIGLCIIVLILAYLIYGFVTHNNYTKKNSFDISEAQNNEILVKAYNIYPDSITVNCNSFFLEEAWIENSISGRIENKVPSEIYRDRYQIVVKLNKTPHQYLEQGDESKISFSYDIENTRSLWTFTQPYIRFSYKLKQYPDSIEMYLSHQLQNSKIITVDTIQLIAIR